MVFDFISKLFNRILGRSTPTATAAPSFIEREPATEIIGGRVMYLTREDSKVDEICEVLNRTIYYVDDPDIPIPIQDTHFGCRCRLVPLD